MTHNLNFKVATLRNAKDGEPKVECFDIPSFVKMVSKPKRSGCNFEAYHNQKAAQKQYDNEARVAREAGDKELANELKAKSKAMKDALTGTKDGKAIMPFVFKNDVTFKIIKDDWKQRDNDQIEAFSLIMLDIESKISKEQIHDVLKDFEYVLWPTVTHRPEDPRFRVVLFPEAPLSVEDAQALIFRIDTNLPSKNPLTAKTQAIDPASVEAGRLMYLPLWLVAHPEEYFCVHNAGALVNATSFKLSASQLLAMSEREKASAEAKDSRRASSIKAAISKATDDSTLIERNGQVWLNPRGHLESDKGWHLISSINGKISNVACPAHGDTTGSEWVSLNSFTNRPQLNCKHCGTIKMLPEDFDNDDDNDDQPTPLLWKRKQKVEPTKIKPESTGLVMQEVADLHYFNERYLPADSIKALPAKGVLLVKSPKGTGKTEFLKIVAEKCGKEKKKTLLLGHRVFLLKNIAERTGLDYYRDIEDRGLTDGIALCMNSLTRLDPSEDKPYHTVIIDESEQVLLHLASRTLARDRAVVFNNLIWVLKNATRIICMDADLTSALTIQLLKEIRGEARMESEQAIGIINDYVFTGRNTTIYESRWQVIGEFIDSAEKGKRCYFATNSAKEAHILGDVMTTMGISHLVVTAKTNETEECMNFIADPTTLAKNYQVVIASPTAQTGISIDSDVDGSPQFDIIYGSFINAIGTYQDIDQALSRVRGCNDTRVWVQLVDHKVEPKTEEAIYDEAIATEQGTRMLILGEEQFHLTKGERLWASIYARLTWLEIMWSRHKLEKFCFLREETGYTLDVAEDDPATAGAGQSIYKAAKELQTGGYVDDLMDAPDINDEEYEELSRKRVRSQEETLMLDRARYQRILGQLFDKANVQAAIQQNLLKGLKALRDVVIMDHDQRVEYDKKTRKAGALTFTDATHRAIEVGLLEELCYAGSLNFHALVKKAQEAAQGRGTEEIEVTQEQLIAMAKYFESEKAEFGRYFGKPRIKDALSNGKKVWEATLGYFHLSLKAKRVGPRGQQTQRYFIDWKKSDLLYKLFDEKGKY